MVIFKGALQVYRNSQNWKNEGNHGESLALAIGVFMDSISFQLFGFSVAGTKGIM